MPFPWLPVLAGASLAGNLWDSKRQQDTATTNTKLTIAANKAAAELEYQRSKEMWNLQNMYNTPAAQMARFKEAGLNPHLIYGQGTPGNAQSAPQYHAPNYEYRYAAGNYGAAIADVLPMLMNVGTWIQQMRLSEAELKNREVKGLTMEETLAQLRLVNPALFEQLTKKNQMLGYQMSSARLGTTKLWQTIEDMRQEYRYKYGEELFQRLPDYGPSYGGFDRGGDLGGLRKLEFLEQIAKTKLSEAKASYTDLGITDPQALMQLVLGMVGSLAGTQLRLSTHKRNKSGGDSKPSHAENRRAFENSTRFMQKGGYDR